MVHHGLGVEDVYMEKTWTLSPRHYLFITSYTEAPSKQLLHNCMEDSETTGAFPIGDYSSLPLS